MKNQEAYRPNWLKAQVGVVIVTAALLAFFLAYQVVGDSQILRWLLAFCFTIWVLVVSIVLGNAASTFHLDSVFLTHRLYGFWVQRISASDIASFRTELGVWPGIFELTNGTKIRVSGIAVGQTDNLSEYLSKFHPHIEQEADC